MKNEITYRRFIRINGNRLNKSFSRKSDADRWYSEMKRKKELVQSGVEPQIESQLLEEFSAKWLSVRKASGQPLSSYIVEEARLRKYVIPEFGHRKMNEISSGEWDSFFESLILDHNLKPATRNRVYSMMSKMYNDALRKHIVHRNPIEILLKLKESMDKSSFWETSEEVSKYLEIAKEFSPSIYLFAMCSLNLGTRVGETLAFNCSDVDLKNRRIRVWRILEDASGKVVERTKGFKPRWLGMNDSLADAIKMCLSEYKSTPNTPLIRQANGNRYDHRTIRKIHFGLCSKAEIKPIRVHDLRHTYASHYVMNGGNRYTLQSVLGHASPSMTQKYAHLRPGFLESHSNVVSFAVTKKET